MRTFLSKRSLQIVVFVLFDVFSIAMGMGVPFFTILYGFLVGLFIPRILREPSNLSPHYLRSIMRVALITCSLSLLVLAVLWLPALTWLFDAKRDLANFGMPMILFTPRASFIGWIVLMVFISPFLQFLMTLFGSISRIVFSKDYWRSDETPVGDLFAA